MAESYELRGKYHRVDKEEDTPRSSREAAAGADDYDHYSDGSDLDDFDPLIDEHKRTTSTTRPTSSRGRRDANSSNNNARELFTPRRSAWRRWLVPGRMCCFVTLLFVGAAVLVITAGGIWAWKVAPAHGQSEAWYPSPAGGTVEAWADSYAKAAELVRQMTVVEKVNVTTGVGWMMGMCVGNTGAVPRLGFGSLCLQDGPLGVRYTENVTAFPAGVTVGATWDKSLFYNRGRLHAIEAKAKGVNVLLGPSMGPLGRAPGGGRNWEGFGADPVLQGIAARETIRGIQEQGIIATAKHWVGNEQEHFRQSWEWGTPNAISSNFDDRALHELYAWPFAESVRAGVGSVMCAYNQVNNSYACQNSKLMNGVLKDELGFQGFVQSDWLAQRSGVASALAGLDMSMPGDGLRWTDGKPLWGGKLTQAVLNGSVPTSRLDDMVTRIVAAWYQMGQDNQDKWPQPPEGGPNFSSWTNEETGKIHPGSDDETTAVVNKFVNAQKVDDPVGNTHGQLARQVAAAGHVVLKNEDDILPLPRKGWNGDDVDEGVKSRVGIFGEDARVNANGPNSCNDRGCNEGTLAQGWGSGTVEFPYLSDPLSAIRDAFDEDTVYVTNWPKNELPKKERQIVEDQDVCIVFANADAGEGFIKANGIAADRTDLRLQKGGDQLIKEVSASCGKGAGKTIVVIHAVGPVIMEDWIDLPGISAVVMAHLPGQESGNALVDILFGDVAPSGRLPYTIAKSLDDYGPGAQILTFPNHPVPQQNFTEGLYIDYRYLDKHDIAPRFEFGFGLSYTTFTLNNLLIAPQGSRGLLPAPRPDALAPPHFDTTLPSPSEAQFPTGWRRLKKYIYPYLSPSDTIDTSPYPYPDGYRTIHTPSPAGGAQGGNPDLYTVVAKVSLTVTNAGPRDGSTIVQLYITYPPDYADDETGEPVDFPVRVLRAFEKVRVSKGGRTGVHMELTRKDLSYWCVRRQNWVLPQGEFGVEVGFSSRDLPVKGVL
ncbi:beta-glucosidase-like protein [Pseudovirgaria hyperparasitica]|uniref:Probable beta-glucosidase E n=1 Tax=Pseudovirgaria hyperparasitica TaxID=470096 RepID=A0A6A6VW03_9PEZI|nr:beta-glucosidase-like protein [Pseudovirgaria hyperparasitica]KAF2753427.1 beta-glucosidase-like protein [Pseudovirgaria hyperparasitica]